MPVNLLLFLAALLVSWLVLTWLLKVVKVSLQTALAIAAVVLVLQVSFGISPQKLWQEILNLPRTLTELLPFSQ